jgi:hypothetical protein
VAGYFVDIGVRHAKWPHGFVLGVECDGASYHSAKSARDRDRLRQEVLEGLGWRLHRIWSTDWFNNPLREADKLRALIASRLKELKSREFEYTAVTPHRPKKAEPADTVGAVIRPLLHEEKPRSPPRAAKALLGAEEGDEVEVGRKPVADRLERGGLARGDILMLFCAIPQREFQR